MHNAVVHSGFFSNQVRIEVKDSDRKSYPAFSGLLRYFPDALLAVASVSMEGARKHDTFNENGEPTWDRSKSADDLDALARHLIDAGKVDYDADGHLHAAKVAWRSLAALQKLLDHLAESAAIDGTDYMHKGDGPMAQWRRATVDAAGDAADATALSWSDGGKILKTNLFTSGLVQGLRSGEKINVQGDPGIHVDDIAKLLGVPREQLIDERQPLREKAAAVAEDIFTDLKQAEQAKQEAGNVPKVMPVDLWAPIEIRQERTTRRDAVVKFAMWLTTRPEEVQAGSKVPVYPLVDALTDYLDKVLPLD